MFPYSEVRPYVIQRLDADDTDYYDLNEDEIPSANAALDWCAIQLQSAVDANKFSGESTRDLRRTRIWQASQYGRINFEPAALGHSMLSVLAVMPDPLWLGATPPANPMPNAHTSQLRTNLSLYRPKYNAKRITDEQVSEARTNIFMPGNSVITDPDMIEYAYTTISDYNSTTYTAIDPELTVYPVPPAPGRYVAVTYLKSPDRVSALSSMVMLPMALKDLFVNKLLSYIAYKQGDRTNLYQLSEAAVAQQMKALGW